MPLLMSSELKQSADGHGGEEKDMMNDRDNSVSESGSDHMIVKGGAQDDDVTAGAESPSHSDNEYEISSTVSNPLEDSEYFDRCKVCLQHITNHLSCQCKVHVRGYFKALCIAG